MTLSVMLMGAGGKMGCRVTDQLRDDPAYEMRYVEPSDEGRQRLRDRGVEATPVEEARDGADVVVMAVPDHYMEDILADLVPTLDSGTLILLLDPAAAYAEVLPDREDVSYVLSHPCHPALFDGDRTPEEREDWFGGQGLATQDIVCALHSGDEDDYARGEALARDIYAPVENAYRLTTEQMAVLEPQLVEALLATCLRVLEEGMQEAIEMGVPEEAARSFMYGHMRTETAIVFDEVEFPLSDGAQQIADETKPDLFQPDWKETLFDLENVKRSTETIVNMD